MYALANWAGLRKDLGKADVVIIEYNINDMFMHREWGQTFPYKSELLLSLIQNLPQKPGFMYYELPPDHNHGHHSYHPAASMAHHLEIAAKFKVPLLYLADALKDRIRQNYLDGVGHPWCFPGQETVALSVVGAFLQELSTVCSGRADTLDIDQIPAPWKAAGASECLAVPLYARSAKSKPSLNVSAAGVQGWVYPGSDGKPAWTAKQGKPAHIAFDIPLKRGEIYVEFLNSYDQIGEVHCALTRRGDELGGATVPLMRFELNGHWDQCVSLPGVSRIEGKVQEGNYTLHCNSDGEVFKIRSLTTC